MFAKRAICILVALVSFDASSAVAATTFDLHNESFISPDYGTETARSYVFAGLHLQTQPLNLEDGSDSTVFKVDVRGELSSALEASYINPRELHLRAAEISLGRKRNEWSTTDQHWRLGLIQPQFRWNPLMPEEQGLVGGFWDHQENNWSMTAFASPIFIPDQGPGFILRGGEFQRVSPWFQAQATTARLTGSEKVRSLDYDIQTPPIDRILLNAGGGVSLSFGTEKTNSQLRLSSLYKPANQISLGVDGTAEPSKVAHIIVAPTIFYQFVASADLIFRNDAWEWTIGGLRENVQDPKDQRPGYSYVTYTPMTLTSTSVTWKNSWSSVRLGFLYRDGGESRTIGALTNDVAELFSDRIPYKDAASLTLSSQKLWKSFSVSTTWLQGLSTGFKQWSVKGDYALNKSWSMWGSTLLVQADAKSPALFRENEDNDSVRIGVSYVF